MLRICFLLLLPFAAEGMRKMRRRGGGAALENVSDSVSVDDEVSVQWSPCLLGMCYKSWGKYRSGNPGVGGLGNSGCKKLVRGCEKGSKAMDCTFGPCPKYFGSPSCTSTKGCRSYCDLRHASACRYDGPVDKSEFSDWMKEFQDVPLNKLFMIEAHHVLSQLGTLDFHTPVESSAKILGQLNVLKAIPILGKTGAITNIAKAHLLPMFSSTQSSDVETLLARGVRAFDLRPYLDRGDGQLHDYHGGRGPLIEPALAAISNFARQHSTEVVIVTIKNIQDSGGDCLRCSPPQPTRQRLHAVLRKHFGKCGGGILHCDAKISQPLKEIVRKGRVILHTLDNQLSEYSADRKEIHRVLSTNRWYDTNDLNQLKRSLLDDQYSQSVAGRSDLLVGHQWLLTPQTNDFVGAVSQRHTGNYQAKANRYGCQSLACMAEVASAQEFERFLPQVAGAYAKSNMLMLDFADRQGNMDVVLRINRQRARSR